MSALTPKFKKICAILTHGKHKTLLEEMENLNWETMFTNKKTWYYCDVNSSHKYIINKNI